MDEEDEEEVKGQGRKYGYPTVKGEVDYRVRRCGLLGKEVWPTGQRGGLVCGWSDGGGVCKDHHCVFIYTGHTHIQRVEIVAAKKKKKKKRRPFVISQCCKRKKGFALLQCVIRCPIFWCINGGF